MLAFLMTIADEQYSAKIERLYHRYHKPMLRIAKQRFANAKRSNPGLDAEDAVQGAFTGIVPFTANSICLKPSLVRLSLQERRKS